MKIWGWLLPACAALAAPGRAADWWIVVQRDGAGNVHFGESSQLRRTGDIVLFWSHLFYREPIDGMKSARVQYEVDCATLSMRERRYLDFDADHQVIDSGDNSGSDPWREVAPGTSGAAYLEFACATPAQRQARFLSVDAAVDLFAVADFFLDPSPIVEVPPEPGPR
jgi:hypothetical protein